jgi:glycosyltransferase involved in cell wall biosynthesis
MAQSKEKILFLITKATWGGAQRYVYDLATNLPKERFEVVVAYGEAGKLSDDLKRAGITTYQVRSMGRDVSPFADVQSFWKIYKGIRKGCPDVVHLNSSKAAALGALAARIAGVSKIIFTVHGWPFGEKRNPISKILIWTISWLTALLSTRVICVSDYDLTLAKRMPFVSNKAVRIYNGIAPMQFGSGDIIRRAFPAGAKITGTIGELTHNKNQIALIEEARRDSNMHIAIVGEGELRSELEKKIAQYGLHERVKLFGFLPAAEVLKGFDEFALPSIKEGLPYTLIEAKQAGLPIVASRVGGVGEVIDKPASEFTFEKMLAATTALY